MPTILKSVYKVYLFEDFDNITDNFLEKCIAVLPEERAEKAKHYRFDIDKKMSVISYLLLLYALRENYGINVPKMSYGRYGKPYLTDYPDIYFNISHCPKGCVCAVSDKEIGVDIQDIRPFSWDIAKRVCCENELKMLEHADDRAMVFTKIWSMKESYVKMTGKGIASISSVNTTVIRNGIMIFEKDIFVISVSEKRGNIDE